MTTDQTSLSATPKQYKYMEKKIQDSTISWWNKFKTYAEFHPHKKEARILARHD
jgi:hypothetical protein